MHCLSKSLEIRFRVASLALAWGVFRVEKSPAILEHLMTFRSSISTGKPEQILSLMCFFFRFPEVMMAYRWYHVIWAQQGSSYELKWSVTEMEWIREASSGGGGGGGETGKYREMVSISEPRPGRKMNWWVSKCRKSSWTKFNGHMEKGVRKSRNPESGTGAGTGTGTGT